MGLRVAELVGQPLAGTSLEAFPGKIRPDSPAGSADAVAGSTSLRLERSPPAFSPAEGARPVQPRAGGDDCVACRASSPSGLL